MKSFNLYNLSSNLQAAIKKLGFSEPTLIQHKAIPPILEGKDVVGESMTGSGKTLAFGVGIIEKITPGKGLQALILTPTRELAEQVKTSLQELTGGKRLKIISIYGGVSINPQIDALPKADVVVATPGRLLDHMERQTINLSQVKQLVIDEADRMFDMGFIDDVEKIMRRIPKKRQTLLFSATISARVKKLAEKHMHNHVFVLAEKQVDPKKLTQMYYNVKKHNKLSVLVHLLRNEQSSLVMVFCNTRRNTDFVVKNLRANGVKAVAIHGGMTQNKREKTIQTFHDKSNGVLVCTDVAARGLHIDNVSHVYNYDLPSDPTDYVHRIGRTARAGEDGKIINLLSDIDHANFTRILDEHRYDIACMKTPYTDRVKVMTSQPMRKKKFRRFGNRRRN